MVEKEKQLQKNKNLNFLSSLVPHSRTSHNSGWWSKYYLKSLGNPVWDLIHWKNKPYRVVVPLYFIKVLILVRPEAFAYNPNPEKTSRSLTTLLRVDPLISTHNNSQAGLLIKFWSHQADILRLGFFSGASSSSSGRPRISLRTDFMLQLICS